MAKKTKDQPKETVEIGRYVHTKNEEAHPIDAVINSEDAPEIKSVGFMRINPLSNTWISYVMTTKGNKVLKIEVDEPNLRGIAEESAKIQFVQLFIDQE